MFLRGYIPCFITIPEIFSPSFHRESGYGLPCGPGDAHDASLLFSSRRRAFLACPSPAGFVSLLFSSRRWKKSRWPEGGYEFRFHSSFHREGSYAQADGLGWLQRVSLLFSSRRGPTEAGHSGHPEVRFHSSFHREAKSLKTRMLSVLRSFTPLYIEK